ncbi:hypothetical protein QTJ16_006998 [Diplocarpon rosae]|uniref:Copper homeostasis protein cutC homolog n=1 Tax=Diplocarpon rosae TaxID=946125 RepID=A0AAD9SUR6_9HELO|nr:hypothetical protein QTJ16_006998 [Diplocarpon rosae]
MPFLEIASFNVESALLAQAHGANRIELCAEQALGGISPSVASLQALKQSVTIPVYVMVRPRGGDFTYNDAELARMRLDLEKFKAAGADGFVFGILTEEGGVDTGRCRDLVVLAEGRPCTFHRAFDRIPEEGRQHALLDLVSAGFRNVLTSGGEANAVEGREALKNLVLASRQRIDIIVGGGVRSGNLEILMREIEAEWFHSSAVVGGGDLADGREIRELSRLVNG